MSVSYVPCDGCGSTVRVVWKRKPPPALLTDCPVCKPKKLNVNAHRPTLKKFVFGMVNK